jgi:hypothetical protein
MDVDPNSSNFGPALMQPIPRAYAGTIPAYISRSLSRASTSQTRRYMGPHMTNLPAPSTQEFFPSHEDVAPNYLRSIRHNATTSPDDDDNVTQLLDQLSSGSRSQMQFSHWQDNALAHPPSAAVTEQHPHSQEQHSQMNGSHERLRSISQTNFRHADHPQAENMIPPMNAPTHVLDTTSNHLSFSRPNKAPVTPQFAMTSPVHQERGSLSSLGLVENRRRMHVTSHQPHPQGRPVDQSGRPGVIPDHSRNLLLTSWTNHHAQEAIPHGIGSESSRHYKAFADRTHGSGPSMSANMSTLLGSTQGLPHTTLLEEPRRQSTSHIMSNNPWVQARKSLLLQFYQSLNSLPQRHIYMEQLCHLSL